MSLEKRFCSSPWFHMTVYNDGSYDYCRWNKSKPHLKQNNLKKVHPVSWFQNSDEMNTVRKNLLEGKVLDGCQDCYDMEKHQKPSGRQKQLLKTGISDRNFEKTFLSSKWTEAFKQSYESGETNQVPTDWQIDLGNYCNNACIFCSPISSSRMATEYLKIGLIDTLPARNWATDKNSFDSFLEALTQINDIVYIHFIGGEPLVIPQFKLILEKLVNENLNQKITLGFTTNLTVIDNNIIELLKKFKSVHAGVSVECLHELNNYVRYGSNISEVQKNLNYFVRLSKENDWILSLRTTPTFLTVGLLTTIYDYAIENNIFVESCNFLSNPAFFKPSVLPEPFKSKAINDLEHWIEQNKNGNNNYDNNLNINIRSRALIHENLLQDAKSYVNYLKNEKD